MRYLSFFLCLWEIINLDESNLLNISCALVVLSIPHHYLPSEFLVPSPAAVPESNLEWFFFFKLLMLLLSSLLLMNSFSLFGGWSPKSHCLWDYAARCGPCSSSFLFAIFTRHSSTSFIVCTTDWGNSGSESREQSEYMACVRRVKSL